MSIAVAEPEVLERGEQSLAELARVANAEHESVVRAGVSMIEHAICAGEALSCAKRKCSPGEWKRWCAANLDIGYHAAHNYIRVFDHQDKIRQELVDPTLPQALQHIKGLSVSHDLRGWNGKPAQRKAQQLREEGRSYQEIADELGYARDTVRAWLDPKARAQLRAGTARRLRRRRAAAKALAREERDRAVREAGGAGAEAYSLVRRAAAELHDASTKASSKEARQHFNTAYTRLTLAEDEIVRALGVS